MSRSICYSLCAGILCCRSLKLCCKFKQAFTSFISFSVTIICCHQLLSWPTLTLQSPITNSVFISFLRIMPSTSSSSSVNLSNSAFVLSALGVYICTIIIFSGVPLNLAAIIRALAGLKPISPFCPLFKEESYTIYMVFLIYGRKTSSLTHYPSHLNKPCT